MKGSYDIPVKRKAYTIIPGKLLPKIKWLISTIIRISSRFLIKYCFK